MKFIYYIVSFALFITLSSCNSNPSKKAEPAVVEKPKTPFEKFTSNFRAVRLPVYLPPTDDTLKPKELLRADIDSFIKKNTFISAFGDKKVAGLGESPSTTRFYADEIITGPATYCALVLKKHETNDYYYVVTFKKTGEFISGLCIAFREENKDGVTERNVSLNEDFSIEVRQTDVTGPKDPIAKNAFFEITPEGVISRIKKGA
jgi:hypothetical protein